MKIIIGSISLMLLLSACATTGGGQVGGGQITADVDGVANGVGVNAGGVNSEGINFQRGDTSTTITLQNATRGETHISDAVCIATDMLRCSGIVNGEQGECETQKISYAETAEEGAGAFGVFLLIVAAPVVIMECFESASEASGGDQGTE